MFVCACIVGMNMAVAPRGGGMDNYPGSWSNNDNRVMQHNPGMSNPSSEHYIQPLQ